LDLGFQLVTLVNDQKIPELSQPLSSIIPFSLEVRKLYPSQRKILREESAGWKPRCGLEEIQERRKSKKRLHLDLLAGEKQPRENKLKSPSKNPEHETLR